ncbi:MAG: cytochrome c biogenesis protein CcsA [Ignavibacteriales bacterium]|nr:cytochrome c biogenesis protein CcsA [Ignavibacteriales bacterium]
MKIVRAGVIILITVAIVLGVSIPMVPKPQSFFEYPIIPGLEEKARNIFFHVPVAWTTVVAFLVSLWYGYRYLRTRDIQYDLKSSASAELGFVFCFLATITGALWAKFNWGSFWNWDPRETSIFVLLLIYGAYFALRSAIDVEETRARLSAVYSILAGLTVPFFIFALPRLVGGLHPGSAGDASGQTPVAQLHMRGLMLLNFFLSMIGFNLLFVWLLNLRVRIARLEYHHSLQSM